MSTITVRGRGSGRGRGSRGRGGNRTRGSSKISTAARSSQGVDTRASKAVVTFSDPIVTPAVQPAVLTALTTDNLKQLESPESPLESPRESCASSILSHDSGEDNQSEHSSVITDCSSVDYKPTIVNITKRTDVNDTTNVYAYEMEVSMGCNQSADSCLYDLVAAYLHVNDDRSLPRHLLRWYVHKCIANRSEFEQAYDRLLVAVTDAYDRSLEPTSNNCDDNMATVSQADNPESPSDADTPPSYDTIMIDVDSNHERNITTCTTSNMPNGPTSEPARLFAVCCVNVHTALFKNTAVYDRDNCGWYLIPRCTSIGATIISKVTVCATSRSIKFFYTVHLPRHVLSPFHVCYDSYMSCYLDKTERWWNMWRGLHKHIMHQENQRFRICVTSGTTRSLHYRLAALNDNGNLESSVKKRDMDKIMRELAMEHPRYFNKVCVFFYDRGPNDLGNRWTLKEQDVAQMQNWMMHRGTNYIACPRTIRGIDNIIHYICTHEAIAPDMTHTIGLYAPWCTDPLTIINEWDAFIAGVESIRQGLMYDPLSDNKPTYISPPNIILFSPTAPMSPDSIWKHDVNYDLYEPSLEPYDMTMADPANVYDTLPVDPDKLKEFQKMIAYCDKPI